MMTRPMMVRAVSAAMSLTALAACSMSGSEPATTAVMETPARAGGAEAILKTAAGATVGRATATAAGGGVRIAIEGSGMPPGTRGVHVHTTGRCDAPEFTTAGGHWNPGGKMHGMENPAGPHAGDMPNLTVDASGRGALSFMLPAGTMAGLLDADGSAFVVHAGPDDMRTDPAGNSGGRIACGVFVAT